MVTSFSTRDEAQPQTAEELSAIAAAQGPARAVLINDFMTRRMDLFRRFAVGLTRRLGIHPDSREDIAQLVAETAYLMLSDLNTTVLPTRWEGLLYVSANSRVRSYLESGAYTPASGMTSRTRRASKLAYVRAKLQATTGREPTDAEVISAWNAEAHGRYADAVRQGMVASEADLAPVTSRNIDDTVLSVVDLRDDFVLHPAESAGFVASVTRACEQVSARAREVTEEATRSGSRVPAGTREDMRLGEIAVLWVGASVSEVPFIRNPAEVAEDMGISYEVARRGTNRVREIAMEILRDGYDIHSG